MEQLITKNIWRELTLAAKHTKTKSFVAVAYFGQNGSQQLPLKKGSILVVDASENALKKGQTCPDELLKLYYKGVRIFSHENLHAKIYLFGNTLYCGSANVSNNSAYRFTEALLKTNNKNAANDAEIFITTLAKNELGDNELERMAKIYVAPKSSGKKIKDKKSTKTRFYVVNLRLKDWSEKEHEEADKGREVANKNRIEKLRHRLDEFTSSGKINFKKGDTILQITKDGENKFVSPLGKLIHIRKWSNGKSSKYICYVEVPDKRRKNLTAVQKRLNEIDAKALQRQGKKNHVLQENINALWK